MQSESLCKLLSSEMGQRQRSLMVLRLLLGIAGAFNQRRDRLSFLGLVGHFLFLSSIRLFFCRTVIKLLFLGLPKKTKQKTKKKTPYTRNMQNLIIQLDEAAQETTQGHPSLPRTTWV